MTKKNNEIASQKEATQEEVTQEQIERLEFEQRYEILRRANEKLQNKVGVLENNLSLAHAQIELYHDNAKARQEAVKEQ